jgi:hypothetical protein
MFVPHCGSEQQAMFVYIVQFGESPENVVSAFVWFNRVDFVSASLARTWDAQAGHDYAVMPDNQHLFVSKSRNRKPLRRK